MAGQSIRTVVRHLRSSVRAGEVAALSDARLLEKWASDRDEAAFELLLRRHGPMVFGVCRRVLGHTQDAEDAFQATFLVLVHKAGAIQKRTALGSWLYKVAYRAALRAKTRLSLPASQNEIDPDTLAAEPSDDLVWSDSRAILDEEIGKLPPRYRAAFVLCCLENKTNEEAAREIGCPLGTVLSRLSRARQLLRVRLTRRGLALTTGTMAALLAQQTAASTPPPALLSKALQASLLYDAGRNFAAGGISTTITSLTEGVLKTMFFAKVKIAAIVLLTLALLGGGAGLLTYPSLAQEQQNEVTQGSDTNPGKAAKPQSKLAAVFEGSQSSVESVAFSPDGKLIVSGDGDGAVRLWNVATGEQVRRQQAHKSVVTAVTFAPDGKSLASSGNDGNIVLWDAATGKKKFQYSNNRSAIHSLAVSPDGRTVVFGGKDRTIHVLDAATGRETMRIQGPGAAVSSLAVSPDGGLIVWSGAKDRSVVFWDAQTGQRIREVPFWKIVQTFSLAPGGRRLAVADEKGAIHVVDIASGKHLRTFQGHTKVVAAMAFSPDGKLLATGGKDKTIRLWDVQTGVQIRIGLHNGPVTSLAFSPDGKRLVTGSKDRTVKLWIVIPLRDARILPAAPDRLGRLVQHLTDKNKTDEECIEALYLATLARFPTAGEMKAMQRQLDARGKQRGEALKNIVFALTTSREFSSHVTDLRKRDTRQTAR